MANNQKQIEELTNKDYEYGFVSDIDVEEFPKGLNEDIVRMISKRKNEPDWLLVKLIIIDSSIAYVGSANLTGAGMGMKSPKKRNFEAGILTDDPEMVEAAIEQFDNVWIGKFCKECGRREYCYDPIK